MSARLDSRGYPMPENGWTCYHCGETFTTWGSAEDHFGKTPEAKPGCLIKVQFGNERGLGGRGGWREGMNEPTFTIQTDAYGNRWIRCRCCGFGSYHPDDIEQKYCGRCHMFHAEVNPVDKAAYP